jgi:hypothetical protein
VNHFRDECGLEWKNLFFFLLFLLSCLRKWGAKYATCYTFLVRKRYSCPLLAMMLVRFSLVQYTRQCFQYYAEIAESGNLEWKRFISLQFWRLKAMVLASVQLWWGTHGGWHYNYGNTHGRMWSHSEARVPFRGKAHYFHTNLIRTNSIPSWGNSQTSGIRVRDYSTTSMCCPPLLVTSYLHSSKEDAYWLPHWCIR